MKIQILRASQSSAPICILDLPEAATLDDLKAAFHAKNSKFYPDRQRFYLPDLTAGAKRPVALKDGALSEQGVADGGSLKFKDLGPQIAWRTVFVVEYAGPMILYPLFWLQPAFIYGKDSPGANHVQTLAMVCFVLHYVKRELETLFVHRFSHGTMPIFNLLKNSVYYWGFAAAIAYYLNHPLYTPPRSPVQVYVCLALFVLFEALNAQTHLALRNLRPAGTRVRQVPRGGLFELVSCPNYTCEIAAWIAFNGMTGTLFGWIFMCVGAAQMVIWAIGKHKNYRKEFDGTGGKPLYPKNRKIIFPFVF